MTAQAHDEFYDGGPAFPTERFTGYGNGAGVTTREGGMTLLDWFAGQALASLPISGAASDEAIQGAAEVAYRIGRAMIAERARGENG